MGLPAVRDRQRERRPSWALKITLGPICRWNGRCARFTHCIPSKGLIFVAVEAVYMYPYYIPKFRIRN